MVSTSIKSAELAPIISASELPEALLSGLTTWSEFADLSHWSAQKLSGGGVSQYTFRLFNPSSNYFVKQTTENEKYTLELMDRVGLKVAPRVHSRDLLEQGILVTDFIEGERLKSKKLQPQLVCDFAEMQNVLNNPKLFDANPTPSGCKFNDRDNDLFGPGTARNFQAGRQNLIKLKEVYNLSIIDEFSEIADDFERSFDRYIQEFSGMPFAWQHHDFREDNIVGNPQRLIDWGSSYGHGPFMFDLAPFLVEDPKMLALFSERSEICRAADMATIERWLLVALGARFAEFINGRIVFGEVNVDTRETCDCFLQYEYAPFAKLKSIRL